MKAFIQDVDNFLSKRSFLLQKGVSMGNLLYVNNTSSFAMRLTDKSKFEYLGGF